MITLGIIGVVAAMTIPTLVANYNTKSWDTAATVFDRKLEEALKTMNTQSTLAGHTTTESFVQELSKHFKTNKICQNDELLDCFSETVRWGGGEATPEEVDMSIIKTAKNFGQKDWGTNIVGVQFANGVSALIAYNPTTGENSCTQDPYSNQISGGDCLAILYDTSANKNPNEVGKDLRANGNVKKLGATCAYEVEGVCYGATFKLDSGAKHYWNECLSGGTTTDPEDLAYMQKYNIKYCLPSSYIGDRWAKIVETCGGTDNMPTKSQLSKIGGYLKSQGFNDSDFQLWSGEERSGGVYSESISYSSFGINNNGTNRQHAAEDLFAICIQ